MKNTLKGEKSMFSILFGIIIIVSIFLAMKYLKGTKHCGHNCNECRHPCHIRY